VCVVGIKLHKLTVRVTTAEAKLDPLKEKKVEHGSRTWLFHTRNELLKLADLDIKPQQLPLPGGK
jgi:hypothetical protein